MEEKEKSRNLMVKKEQKAIVYTYTTFSDIPQILKSVITTFY